ncbi:MAG: transposase domain-containing protein [Planktomarina sp.]
MKPPQPTQIWWTATEIAAAALPGLPTTQQGVDKLAKAEGWRDDRDHGRRRKGRGGGFEYHWRLFPKTARTFLLRGAKGVDDAPAVASDADRQAYFEGLPQHAKDKARTRFDVLNLVEAHVRDGHGKHEAITYVAKEQGLTARTIWNWYQLIEGRAVDQWLFYLAPRGKGASGRPASATCDPAFMAFLKGDYLRLEQPSFKSCYRRAVRVAQQKGWAHYTLSTAERRLKADVPRVTRVFAREGLAGLQRCFPPQIRDRSKMTSLEAVNADCHKFDVFVLWPGETKPSRAQIVAFQDIYSGKVLSWRVDHSPNKVAVMAAFGDMIEEYGIPQHCLFDNGREFANKWLTAGTKTRFRFKVREDDPLGVLPLLGIDVHWATPGHGQAKPIERAFRDFADDIAKDPRFAGAYVGHKPDAKPENYMSHAVPMDLFLEVVAEGVLEHNARQGRTSDTAKGRSFDDTFSERYGQVPVRKATDEQRRLWLMGQEVKTLHRGHGRMKLHGNEYWSGWMNEYAGQQVVVRFDPEDLHAGVYVYDKAGSFLGYATCQQKVGFFDLTGAQDHARRQSAIRRAERKLLKEKRAMSAADVAAALSDLAPQEKPSLDAKVVSGAFGKAAGRTALVEAPRPVDTSTEEDRAAHAAFVADFNAEKANRAAAFEKAKEPLDRFEAAIEMECRRAAGKPLGDAESQWLRGYQTTGEYRGMMRMYEDVGDVMFLK